MTWCEHIQWYDNYNNWCIRYKRSDSMTIKFKEMDGTPCIISSKWNFCPICGKEKPKEEK